MSDIPPLWEPETWNCYEKILASKRRITGSALAWHRRLENIIERSHPDFISFCEAIMGEWIKIQTEIEQLGTGLWIIYVRPATWSV